MINLLVYISTLYYKQYLVKYLIESDTSRYFAVVHLRSSGAGVLGEFTEPYK